MGDTSDGGNTPDWDSKTPKTSPTEDSNKNSPSKWDDSTTLVSSSPQQAGNTPKRQPSDEIGEADFQPPVVHYQRGKSDLDETGDLSNGTTGATAGSAGSVASSGSSGAAFRGAVAAAPPPEHRTEPYISQVQYNHNRVALDRALNTAAQVVQELRVENRARPTHYPSVDGSLQYDARLNSKDSQLAMLRKKSSTSSIDTASHVGTTTGDSGKNIAQIQQAPMEVLRLDLRLGPGSAGSDGVMEGLDQQALSTLIDEKLAQVLRQLSSLKDRIDDTSSKVLVTGDLNSGKSAFCNTLLRREVMPEDQEPCTSVFCEIIDAQENNGMEEVHAVPIGSDYKRSDHRTYKRFDLKDLQDLVYQAETYQLLYVYVTDNRPPQQSLLHNGVIDIRLIDAPGLNLDSYHTMELFSRQEEIDLVVFVVNAENHFTLSGREFISNAANDKNLMFIVVNKFDQIKNKERCQRRIMEQLQPLSPETYKNADEFVHFVSSTESKHPSGGGGGGGGDDPGDDPGDNGPDDDNNYGADHPDFDRLEASLRGFILEKRAMSKLLPAKTYLRKLYSDLGSLANLNEALSLDRRAEIEQELNEITPIYDNAVKESVRANESVMKLVEKAGAQVYQYARRHISDVIDHMSDAALGVPFNGYNDITNFAAQTQQCIVDRIVQSVSESEDYARNTTSDAVDSIREIGNNALGEDHQLPATKFLPGAMYSRRKDTLQRQIDTSVNVRDFVDPNLESFCQIVGIKLPSASTNAVIGAVCSKLWKTGLSGLIVMYGPQILSAITGVQSIAGVLPSAVTKTVLPISLVGLFIGLPSYYLYMDAPHAYQRNVVRKMKKSLEEEDYSNSNSLRIAKEVRQVLNYPANDVSIGLNNLIESQSHRRSELSSDLKNCEAAMRFYRDLAQRVRQQNGLVESCDLMAVD